MEKIATVSTGNCPRCEGQGYKLVNEFFMGIPGRKDCYLCSGTGNIVMPTSLLRVKDPFKFRKFNYISEPSTTYQLADVLAKPILDNEFVQTGLIEVGVVIQTFKDGDSRTDMWGMASLTEVRPATLEEIKALRPDVYAELELPLPNK